MSVYIRPDPLDQFIIINIDGKLVSAENQHQDIEFSVFTSDGRAVRHGRSSVALSKALGELKVIKDLDQIKELQQQIEARVAAKGPVTIAARSRDHGLEIADYNAELDDYPQEDELEWESPEEMLAKTKPPLG